MTATGLDTLIDVIAKGAAYILHTGAHITAISVPARIPEGSVKVHTFAEGLGTVDVVAVHLYEGRLSVCATRRIQVTP